jgi:hypothetical protein
MKVEELEVDRLYQSVCYDITNLYVYHGGHGRKWYKTKYNPGTESEIAYEKCLCL